MSPVELEAKLSKVCGRPVIAWFRVMLNEKDSLAHNLAAGSNLDWQPIQGAVTADFVVDTCEPQTVPYDGMV